MIDRQFALLLATAAVVALFAAPAAAQDTCAEGRTFSGECVNAGLAAGLREAAVIFSHPKISQTAFPVLPDGDRDYRYPNELIPDPLTPSATGDVPSP